MCENVRDWQHKTTLNALVSVLYVEHQGSANSLLVAEKGQQASLNQCGADSKRYTTVCFVLMSTDARMTVRIK